MRLEHACRRLSLPTAAIIVFLGGMLPQRAAAIDLILPTSNHALFEGRPEDFYMFTSEGRDTPWEGGQYGYVRNGRQTKLGEVFTRFHEGVDIKPVYRDAAGKPLDTVMSISQGRVAYACTTAGRSNYGRYIVVEHIWDGSPYYSLYAHLNEVWVSAGDIVEQGSAIGLLGYTGVGINRRRAHLHFEVGLLLSNYFDAWHSIISPRDSNYHGISNGHNISGVDVARLYLTMRDDPSMTMPEFLATEKVGFRMIVPNTGPIDLLERYPWLMPKKLRRETPPSWEIAFSSSCLPLSILPSKDTVAEPTVAALPDGEIPYTYVTHGMLRGSGEKYTITRWGRDYLDLLMHHGDEERAEK
jgi:murein DD-endopeptidase MepM/ murein hydrolase activator NlpD